MAEDRLKKVKSLRGALYRKLTKKKGDSGGKNPLAETPFPGFEIKKTEHIVEFPSMEDITKIDVTYPLIEPFVHVNIKWDPGTKELMYVVVEPKLDEKDKKLIERISEALIEIVEVELTAIQKEGTAIGYLETQIKKVLKEFGIDIVAKQYTRIMYYIYRNFVGFNEIEPLLQDPNIEDISCDGTNTPIYIIHRKFGSLKTNIIFDELEYLREFVIKLAERCDRYVSYAEPILSGTLPDGSRVAATLAGDVATRGPTFTIRKFSEKPFSPIDQIRFKTASTEVMAYYWYLVEHGASMLVVGGVATGKTSFLNSICMFIPPEAKIVSIEDTRELRIPSEHWVPSLARTGFGIPTPTGEKYGGVSLFDLLRESFRQNPDYVIVGETRGKEAYVMFQGMSSGHPSMSTFHAGSVDTVIKRLTTPPIELSPTLIESLNIITIMIHAREKGKSARRIREIVEIEKVDAKTNEVKTNVVFQWDPSADTFKWVSPSIIVERLVKAKGGTVEEAYAEIERRRQILEWMYKKELVDYKEVTNVINRYYKEPQNLLKEIGLPAKPPKLVKIPVPPKTTGVKKVVKFGPPSAVSKPEIKKPITELEEPEEIPEEEAEEVEREAVEREEVERLEKEKLERLQEDLEKEIKKPKVKEIDELEKELRRIPIRRKRVSVLNLFGFKFVKEK
jgi:flagellar protein FlaI